MSVKKQESLIQHLGGSYNAMVSSLAFIMWWMNKRNVKMCMLGMFRL